LVKLLSKLPQSSTRTHYLQKVSERLSMGQARLAIQFEQDLRNQVKSRFYYIFWGIATVSVVLGQLYVGSGYRIFAQSLLRIFDAVEVEVGKDYNGERFY